jgi:hypothetical protein
VALLTWEELRTKVYPTPSWVVEGFVPAGSIIFLWGESSIGKTPLCWHLAKSAAAGETFFGWRVDRRWRTLFLEMDQTEKATQERVKDLDMPGVVFEHCGPVLDFEPAALLEHFAEAIAYRPEFLIVDSLRRAHPFEDIKSNIPTKVYSTYRQLFPEAAILFIHHSRKLSKDERDAKRKNPEGDDVSEHESHSGSQAWMNDADHRIHVIHHTQQKFPMKVCVVTSKVGESRWHARFHLEEGRKLTWEGENPDEVRAWIAEGVVRAEVVARLKARGVSQSAAYRRYDAARTGG